MSSPSGSSWPTDASGLARIASDVQRPRQERERALGELRQFHIDTAENVLFRRGVRDQGQADDLVGVVELRLWEGAFPQDHGSYERWCRTVMQNAHTDAVRRTRKERLAPDDALTEEPADARQQEREEQRLDWEAPFSAPDLQRVQSWPNRTRRVVLLCRGLLWRKLPAELWRDWGSAAGLPEPFPPDGFVDLAEEERNRVLAEALGMTVAALHQHWHRGRSQLQQLEFLRGQVS